MPPLRRRGSRSTSYALSVLCVVTCLALASCRTVTWRQSNGGSLQSASNWDGGAVPSTDDDVVIRLADSSTGLSTSGVSSGVRAQYVSNPWDASSSPDEGGDAASANLFTLVEPWSVRSITVTGPARLVFDTQVSVRGSLEVGRASTVYVKGGQLEAAAVTVSSGGTVSLDLAQVGSSRGALLPLRVSGGGRLVMSSPGGANHISNTRVSLSRGAVAAWHAGPLVLDGTTVEIAAGAEFHANAETLAQASANGTSRIDNAGTLVFNATRLASGAQLCGVPVHTSSGGSMIVTGAPGLPSELRFVAEIEHDGTLRVSATRVLALAHSSADFRSGSRTLIGANATLWAQGGETRMRGRVTAEDPQADGGEMLVAATVRQEGEVDVNRLTMRGGELRAGPRSTTAARDLLWLSGRITNGGTSSDSTGTNDGGNSITAPSAGGGMVLAGRSSGLGSLRLSDGSGTKVLAGPTLRLLGSGTIETSNALLMQAASVLQVTPSGVLTHEALSRIECGDDARGVLMRLDSGSQWNFHTLGSSAGRMQSVVSVPVASEASLVVSGAGEAVFRRAARFRTLRAEDTAGVRLQGLANDTQFVFTEPISLADEGQYLLLQGARAEFQSTRPSTVHGLALLDGNATVHAQLDVNTLTLGSPTAAATLLGRGPINAKNVRMQAGDVRLEQMNVAREFILSSAGAKYLGLKNLTFLGGSASRVLASETRVGDALHWWLQSNATLSIEDGAHLHANRPADHTGQPCLHVEGHLTWRGGGGARATSSLEIMNEAEMTVERRDDAASAGVTKPFEAHLSGGLMSSPSSLLTIGPGGALASACPRNMTSPFGCTFGRIVGSGHLRLENGVQTMAAAINVSRITLEHGRNEFFEQAQADELEIRDGDLILHGYAFANQLRVSGGRLIGFPVLNSALVVLPPPLGRGSLTHNATLSLDGVALICEGACELRGGDIVLAGGAQLVVAPGGSLAFNTPSAVLAGAAGAGTITNAGEMAFVARAHTTAVRVPLLNRGTLVLRDGADVAFSAALRQNAPGARILVEHGATLRKIDGGAVEADTGSVENSGLIAAHLQLGGRLVRSADAPAAVVHGDVILAPTASVSAHCGGGGGGGDNQCMALSSNGTVYLDGLANLTFSHGAVGGAHSIVAAGRVVGTFKDTSSGAIADGAVYNMEYSSRGASASVHSLLVGEATSRIPSFYDESTTSPLSVLLPNLAPSPDATDARAFAIIDGGEGDAYHHMHHSSDDADHESDMSDMPTMPKTDPSGPTNLTNGTSLDLDTPAGALGMARKTAEGLLVFLMLLAAGLCLAGGFLLCQRRNLRTRLAELCRDGVPPPTQTPAQTHLIAPGTTATSSPAPPAVHPPVAIAGTTDAVGRSPGEQSHSSSAASIAELASSPEAGPGHALVAPRVKSVLVGAAPPATVTRRPRMIRRESVVATPEDDAENGSEEGKQHTDAPASRQTNANQQEETSRLFDADTQ